MEFSKFMAGFTLIRHCESKQIKFGLWIPNVRGVEGGGTHITHRSGPSLLFPRPCFRAP